MADSTQVFVFINPVGENTVFGIEGSWHLNLHQPFWWTRTSPDGIAGTSQSTDPVGEPQHRRLGHPATLLRQSGYREGVQHRQEGQTGQQGPRRLRTEDT